MDIGAHQFFQSFMSSILDKRLISDKDIESINIQLMEVLESQLRLYTRALNSSVKTEVAQHVMQSNLYAISYYLKQFDFDECILLVTQNKLSSLLDDGRKQIRKDVQKAKHILDTIKNNLIKTKNHAYNDTIKHGIPMFFANYNVDERAHETPGSIDYPISGTEIGFVGIEYMTRYLKKLYLENTFCKQFNDSDIEALLIAYNANYRDLLLNIFEIVLTNIAGSILLGNNPPSINISEVDRLYLIRKLSFIPPLRLKLELYNASSKIVKEYNIESELFKSHVTEVLISIAHVIDNAIKYNKLDTVFASHRNSKGTSLQLDDSNRLTDDKFRNITEEIRSCRHTTDKVSIIREHIKSTTDLIDVFEAYCLQPNDYNAVFKSMSDIEIAILLKHATEYATDSIHTTHGQLEWYSNLQSYVKGMESAKRIHINTLVDELATSLQQIDN